MCLSKRVHAVARSCFACLVREVKTLVCNKLLEVGPEVRLDPASWGQLRLVSQAGRIKGLISIWGSDTFVRYTHKVKTLVAFCGTRSFILSQLERTLRQLGPYDFLRTFSVKKHVSSSVCDIDFPSYLLSSTCARHTYFYMFFFFLQSLVHFTSNSPA